MGRVNKDEIKKALDAFEADDFLTAKDIIKKEVQSHISDYYKEKLELTKDVNITPETKSDNE